MDRLVGDDENLGHRKDLFEKYDYSQVNEVIADKRELSFSWLANALSKEHKGPAGLYDFVRGRIREMERRISDLAHQNKELQKRVNGEK